MISAQFFDGQTSQAKQSYFSKEGEYYVVKSAEDGLTLHQQLLSPAIASYKEGIFLELELEHGRKLQFQRHNSTNAFHILSDKKLELKDRVRKLFSPLNALLIFSVFLLLCFGVYKLMTSDVFVERVVAAIPVETESKMGQTLADQYKASVLMDSVKTEQLSNFYRELNFHSHFTMHITYVDDSTVNAFALPGGHIFVHRGLVERMDTYEELAAVLAHETIHITRRHSLKSLVRSVMGYAIISFLIGDVSGLSAVVVENASVITNLSFSRKFEEEADQMGLDLLCQNSIPTYGMGDLFAHLEAYEKEITGGVSEDDRLAFLRTHPLNKSRMERVSAFNESADCKENDERIGSLKDWYDLIKGD